MLSIFADADGTYVASALFLAVGVAIGGILGWKMATGHNLRAQYPLTTHVWCAIFLAIGFVAGWCVAAPDPQERTVLRKWPEDKKRPIPHYGKGDRP